MPKKAYSAIEEIKNYALKKGVTILMDVEGTSQEAQMDSKYSFESKDKILLVVVNLLTADEKEGFYEIVRKLFEEGEVIFKRSKEETLRSYTEYSEKNKDRRTLEFFENILDKDDYSALKMGLFIRKLMQEGKAIFTYKQDIRDRFGERGANIANLCTAGYFEEEFIPFYNNYSQEEFSEYYELAVGMKARALFVHSGMTVDDLEDEFEKMLVKAFKYHMNDIRIHGLGGKNVHVIKEFFTKKEKEDPLDTRVFWQKQYDRKEPAVVIEYIVTVLDSQ